MLETFSYFCSQAASKEDKCSMFERLVWCWSDQKLNFTKLEYYLLNIEDKSILNIIILTLFCPDSDTVTNGNDGPNAR